MKKTKLNHIMSHDIKIETNDETNQETNQKTNYKTNDETNHKTNYETNHELNQKLNHEIKENMSFPLNFDFDFDFDNNLHFSFDYFKNMAQYFKKKYKENIENLQSRKFRYIYYDIDNDIFKKYRLIGICGSPGYGKTTLLLQLIKYKFLDINNNINNNNISKDNKDNIKDNSNNYCKNNSPGFINRIFTDNSDIHCINFNNSIYLDANETFFNLFGLKIIIYFLYKYQGIKYFFIDDIDSVKNWTKTLLDIFNICHDIKIFFTSFYDFISSQQKFNHLNINIKIFKLNFLSFREYLYFNNIIEVPPISFENIIGKNYKKFIKEYFLLRFTAINFFHFRDYIEGGYYFDEKNKIKRNVLESTKKIIYDKIPKYFNIESINIYKLFNIIVYCAAKNSENINIHEIAKFTGLNFKTILFYLKILDFSDILHLVPKNCNSNSKFLIFFNNTELLHSFRDLIKIPILSLLSKKTFFVSMMRNINKNVYIDKYADFMVDNTYFIFSSQKISKKRLGYLKNYLSHNSLISLIDEENIFYDHQVPLSILGFLY